MQIKKYILITCCFWHCTFAAQELYEVVPKPLTSTVELVGSWAPLTWHPLHLPIAATLESIDKPYGAVVEANTVLFQFSQPELALKIHEALWETRENQVQVDRIQKWRQSSEYLSAENDLELNGRECESKKSRADETKKLVELGGLAREQWVQEETMYERCLYHLDMAKSRFKAIEEKGSKQALYAARILLSKSKLKLEKLSAQKKQLHVIAPFSGVLLAPNLFQKVEHVPLSVGQEVGAEQWLGVLASKEKFGVVLQINGMILDKIEKSQNIQVVIQDHNVKGAILHIQPQTMPHENQNMLYQVHINLTEKLQAMPRLGYQAKVRFTDTSIMGLQIPLRAIHWENGKASVLLYSEDQNYKKQIIQLGKFEPPFAEVLEGLKKGDCIGLASQSG